VTERRQTAYIITGHTGGIGKSLVSAALGQGHKVIGISRGMLASVETGFNDTQFLELQCDFSQTEGPMLSENQLASVNDLLSGCRQTIYIVNAGQNYDSGRSANEILDNVLKLIQVNAIAQVRLLHELLSYRPNMINKCLFIGSYLTFIKSRKSSIGYVLSKKLLQEFTILYQNQGHDPLKVQTIVLGGVDTKMNRESEVTQGFVRRCLSSLFKMTPDQAARLIMRAAETRSPIKFIPLFPAIPLSIIYYARCLFRVQRYIVRK
jgi:short-subunit dehydrogenase